MQSDSDKTCNIKQVAYNCWKDLATNFANFSLFNSSQARQVDGKGN